MSTGPSPAHGGFAHDENVDHRGNANLGVYLGLVALTFMTGSFVAANVYLRGWNPSKFRLDNRLLQDMPYVYVLLLLISGLLLFITARFFRKNRWRAFNLSLALVTLVTITSLVTEFRLMTWFAGYSPQIATIYAPTAVIEFLLNVVSVILLAVTGWYASYGNKDKVNGFFPVAMNVWLYTILSGIVILLLENVMTVGQFAAWCGQHLT